MRTLQRVKHDISPILPKALIILYQFLHDDLASLLAFLLKRQPKASFYQKLYVIKQSYLISHHVPCPHSQHEIMSFVKTILSIPDHTDGCIVEAGSYKGGSTVKFSIAAKMVNRKLIVFDSFQGIPKNDEPQGGQTIFGSSAYFSKGSYCGTLDEVEGNIDKFGELEVCEFIKGWFGDSMPRFLRPIASIYLDVDLASSTRTCLKYLYRLLTPGGILYSQDGHLPCVINVFNDTGFWEREVGCPKPHIEGLGKWKLIRIVKTNSTEIGK